MDKREIKKKGTSTTQEDMGFAGMEKRKNGGNRMLSYRILGIALVGLMVGVMFGSFPIIADVDAEGKYQIKLTHNLFDEWDPALSPDGSKVAFASNRDGDTEINMFGTIKGSTLKIIDIKSKYLSFLHKVKNIISDVFNKIKMAWPWGSKVKEISDSELDEIRSELDLSYPGDSGFIGSDYYWITDEQLKEALNREIDPENAPGLTYGVYILNAIYEERLIESVLSQNYKIEASKFFNKFMDINTGWSSLASGISVKVLSGILREPSSTGMSSLFLALDAAKTGIGLKALKDLLFYNSLWLYFDCRSGGSTHEEAWQVIDPRSPPTPQDYHVPTRDEKELNEVEKYFKNLWDVYGENLSPDGGLNERFIQQYRKELRAVLFSVLEKTPTSEKITPEPASDYMPWGDPVDKAYMGAGRWAKHNLPSGRYITIPQKGKVVKERYGRRTFEDIQEDIQVPLKPEVVYCTVVGEHSWAEVYYGCNRQYYSVGSDCRRIFPGTGYILYSSDHGRSWEIRKQIPNWCPDAGPFGFEFITETEGYAVGDTGILYTSDGGKHWNFLNLPSEIQVIRGAQSIEGYHLVISCNDGWVKYESFDGGKTWQRK